MFALEKSRLCIIVLHMFYPKAKTMINGNVAALRRLVLALLALAAAGCQVHRPELWEKPVLGANAGSEFDGVYEGFVISDPGNVPACRLKDYKSKITVRNGRMNTVWRTGVEFPVQVDVFGKFYGRTEGLGSTQNFPKTTSGTITGDTMSLKYSSIECTFSTTASKNL